MSLNCARGGALRCAPWARQACPSEEKGHGGLPRVQGLESQVEREAQTLPKWAAVSHEGRGLSIPHVQTPFQVCLPGGKQSIRPTGWSPQTLSRGPLGAWRPANPSLTSSAANTGHLSFRGRSPDPGFLLPPPMLPGAPAPVKEHSHPPPPASLNLVDLLFLRTVVARFLLLASLCVATPLPSAAHIPPPCSISHALSLIPGSSLWLLHPKPCCPPGGPM